MPTSTPPESSMPSSNGNRNEFNGTIPTVAIHESNTLAIAIAASVSFVVLLLLAVLLLYHSGSVKTPFLERTPLGRAHLNGGHTYLVHPSNKTKHMSAEMALLLSRWEVDRSQLTFGEELGCGAFGRVSKGTALQLPNHSATTPVTVAIKVTKGGKSVHVYMQLYVVVCANVKADCW